ncbi:hypothetical protein [Okeania sp. KiyG1]|uniref:hypothetical protein n=1 Tax=Okeania sp. KiyG1 TaxID=2720165 RepID=UPI001923AF9A|nr:hypothetical protein [Okeania sp. KiyG1]GGA36234.1 hypothetical protein CYANOKiyG1_54030 [Okeania sp. KiyG1]
MKNDGFQRKALALPIVMFSLGFILTVSLSFLSINHLDFLAMKNHSQADEYGAEVAGLRARVSLIQTRFAVGEAIIPTFSIKNVSKKQLTIWQPGFWFNHLVIVKDINDKEIPLTELGEATRRAFSPGGPRRKNLPIDLAPGDENTVEVPQDITLLYELLKPSYYTIQIIYEEQGEGWQGKLPSNVLRFEVF